MPRKERERRAYSAVLVIYPAHAPRRGLPSSITAGIALPYSTHGHSSRAFLSPLLHWRATGGRFKRLHAADMLPHHTLLLPTTLPPAACPTTDQHGRDGTAMGSERDKRTALQSNTCIHIASVRTTPAVRVRHTTALVAATSTSHLPRWTLGIYYSFEPY